MTSRFNVDVFWRKKVKLQSQSEQFSVDKLCIASFRSIKFTIKIVSLAQSNSSFHPTIPTHYRMCGNFHFLFVSISFGWIAIACSFIYCNIVYAIARACCLFVCGKVAIKCYGNAMERSVVRYEINFAWWMYANLPLRKCFNFFFLFSVFACVCCVCRSMPSCGIQWTLIFAAAVTSLSLLLMVNDNNTLKIEEKQKKWIEQNWFDVEQISEETAHGVSGREREKQSNTKKKKVKHLHGYCCLCFSLHHRQRSTNSGNSNNT